MSDVEALERELEHVEDHEVRETGDLRQAQSPGEQGSPDQGHGERQETESCGPVFGTGASEMDEAMASAGKRFGHMVGDATLASIKSGGRHASVFTPLERGIGWVIWCATVVFVVWCAVRGRELVEARGVSTTPVASTAVGGGGVDVVFVVLVIVAIMCVAFFVATVLVAKMLADEAASRTRVEAEVVSRERGEDGSWTLGCDVGVGMVEIPWSERAGEPPMPQESVSVLVSADGGTVALPRDVGRERAVARRLRLIGAVLALGSVSCAALRMVSGQ